MALGFLVAQEGSPLQKTEGSVETWQREERVEAEGELTGWVRCGQPPGSRPWW